MKKTENLRTFLQRVDAEPERTRAEIKKTRKTIARLNRYIRTLRKRLKKHEGNQLVHKDDNVLFLAQLSRDKAGRLRVQLIKMQGDWKKKPGKNQKGEVQVRKKKAVQIIGRKEKKSPSK